MGPKTCQHCALLILHRIPLCSCLFSKTFLILYPRWRLLTLLWSSFHDVCKSNHYALYLKCIQCCDVNYISVKLEEGKRKTLLSITHPESLWSVTISESESVCWLSRVWLCDPVDCIARQAPPSVGFSRQEYWSGLPFLSTRDLPDPGIKLVPPALQADSLPAQPTYTEVPAKHYTPKALNLHVSSSRLCSWESHFLSLALVPLIQSIRFLHHSPGCCQHSKWNQLQR